MIFLGDKKINKDMEYLNKTKFDLIEMDWLLHTKKQHTLFSNISTYRIFMEINYKKGHGVSLINFKKITVIQTTQSNHKAIKISITMTGNYTHTTPLVWKLKKETLINNS